MIACAWRLKILMAEILTGLGYVKNNSEDLSDSRWLELCQVIDIVRFVQDCLPLVD